LATLLVPLDQQKHFLRYHHLFADFLREQLLQRYPEQVKPLHLAASRWFEQDNNLMEAVRHACLAKDYANAANLIENAGGWELILYGGIGFLRRLLQYIPEIQLKAHPRLQVAKAYLCQKEGAISVARNYLEQAHVSPSLSQIDFQHKRKAFERDIAIVEVLQSNYEDDFSVSSKHLSLRQVRSDDSIFNGVLNCSLALFMMAEAEFEQGVQYVQQAVRSMRQADSILGTNYCYLHLGVLSFYQGKLRQTGAYFQEAQAMADENFGSDSGLKYLADLLIFSLRDWQGEVDQGLEAFENALSHIENFDGWYEVYIAAYELLLIRAVQDKNIEKINLLCLRCQRVVDERINPRLAIFVDCCRLHIALISADELQGQRILHQYQGLLKAEQAQDWRPLQYLSSAAAQWFMQQKDFNSAEQCLQTLEENCRKTGALCFLVSGLVLRAELEFRRKQLPRAARYLFAAAELAWPENIMRPFICNDCIIALIAASEGLSHDQTVDRLSLNFLKQCSAKARKLRKRTLGQQTILSHREMEVLLKLEVGLTNKEIARALEMTEHTVKFHLKNMFVKLDVDKRAKAVISARALGLLEP
jgi:LuxR family maltose regulon positive regulatory protein